MQRRRFRNLQQVVDEVTAEEIDTITIIPPENQGNVTDEEEAGKSRTPNATEFPRDVAGEVEVEYGDNISDNVSDMDIECNDKPEVPVTSCKPPKKKGKYENGHWNKNDDYKLQIDADPLETFQITTFMIHHQSIFSKLS